MNEVPLYVTHEMYLRKMKRLARAKSLRLEGYLIDKKTHPP